MIKDIKMPLMLHYWVQRIFGNRLILIWEQIREQVLCISNGTKTLNQFHNTHFTKLLTSRVLLLEALIKMVSPS